MCVYVCVLQVCMCMLVCVHVCVCITKILSVSLKMRTRVFLGYSASNQADFVIKATIIGIEN